MKIIVDRFVKERLYSLNTSISTLPLTCCLSNHHQQNEQGMKLTQCHHHEWWRYVSLESDSIKCQRRNRRVRKWRMDQFSLRRTVSETTDVSLYSSSDFIALPMNFNLRHRTTHSTWTNKKVDRHAPRCLPRHNFQRLERCSNKANWRTNIDLLRKSGSRWHHRHLHFSLLIEKRIFIFNLKWSNQ